MAFNHSWEGFHLLFRNSKCLRTWIQIENRSGFLSVFLLQYLILIFQGRSLLIPHVSTWLGSFVTYGDVCVCFYLAFLLNYYFGMFPGFFSLIIWNYSHNWIIVFCDLIMYFKLFWNRYKMVYTVTEVHSWEKSVWWLPDIGYHAFQCAHWSRYNMQLSTVRSGHLNLLTTITDRKQQQNESPEKKKEQDGFGLECNRNQNLSNMLVYS